MDIIFEALHELNMQDLLEELPELVCAIKEDFGEYELSKKYGDRPRGQAFADAHSEFGMNNYLEKLEHYLDAIENSRIKTARSQVDPLRNMLSTERAEVNAKGVKTPKKYNYICLTTLRGKVAREYERPFGINFKVRPFMDKVITDENDLHLASYDQFRYKTTGVISTDKKASRADLFKPGAKGMARPSVMSMDDTDASKFNDAQLAYIGELKEPVNGNRYAITLQMWDPRYFNDEELYKTLIDYFSEAGIDGMNRSGLKFNLVRPEKDASGKQQDGYIDREYNATIDNQRKKLSDRVPFQRPQKDTTDQRQKVKKVFLKFTPDASKGEHASLRSFLDDENLFVKESDLQTSTIDLDAEPTADFWKWKEIYAACKGKESGLVGSLYSTLPPIWTSIQHDRKTMMQLECEIRNRSKNKQHGIYEPHKDSVLAGELPGNTYDQTGNLVLGKTANALLKIFNEHEVRLYMPGDREYLTFEELSPSDYSLLLPKTYPGAKDTRIPLYDMMEKLVNHESIDTFSDVPKKTREQVKELYRVIQDKALEYEWYDYYK